MADSNQGSGFWPRVALVLALAAAPAAQAWADAGAGYGAAAMGDIRISGRDSFRIGDKGVLCTAERRSEDSHYATMFDRGYDVVCRDAASPVGALYVLRGAERQGAFATAGSGAEATCTQPVRIDAGPLPGLIRRECHGSADGLTHVVYTLASHGETFAATGLAAYDSALRLGLAAVLSDRPVAGVVSVAITGEDDPAVLARVQAERLDPAQALAAGAAHANEGSYADASEFFDRLIFRSQQGEAGADQPGLYLADQAMEKSILGSQAEANALFARAAQASTAGDSTFARLYRNLMAMHRLDEANPSGALAVLDAPLPTVGDDASFTTRRLDAGYIDHPLAQRLALDDATRRSFGAGAQPLSPDERAKLLDAQAMYLRGEAHRLLGDYAAAHRELPEANAMYQSVRNGRVESMAWLSAAVVTSLASLDEAEGHPDQAEGLLRQAITMLIPQFPDSAVVLAARARLAGAEARHGKLDTAISEYRELVQEAPSISGGSEALRGQIGPYFAALVARADQPGSSQDFFLASQSLVRPGVAQTQAVLARQLSAGSDAAADLFRQSLAMDREVRAIDEELAEGFSPDHGALDAPAVAALVAHRAQVAAKQTEVQARLASFPRFLAVTDQTAPLAELQKALRPDEAYYKLLVVKDAAYAVWVRNGSARIFAVDASGADLEKLVDTLRDSIAVYDGNQLVTNPFDLVASRHLYDLLFAPVAGELKAVHHLIFEPDGALLKLPVTLLVADQAGVDAYNARQTKPNADAFDFTGIAWLGRDHIVSTAVSARSFLGVREAAASDAPRRYLGLGQNTPLARSPYAPSPNAPRDPCAWPLSTWNHPVSGAELTLAKQILGGPGDEVLTGDHFTDTGLLARSDLGDFRIVQFATHGLVTAPHPGCPAEPELVTSFGPVGSQGLLTFSEIFDLHLNADTVILSACDTAGAASVDATRAAGITTGGNFALDGLVRAFVGAGARSVIASHWPVPDDFDATSKLMGGLFRAGMTEGTGEALRQSQLKLMDDPVTSHPYYWAAFAIVGDAAKPLAGG